MAGKKALLLIGPELMLNTANLCEHHLYCAALSQLKGVLWAGLCPVTAF